MRAAANQHTAVVVVVLPRSRQLINEAKRQAHTHTKTETRIVVYANTHRDSQTDWAIIECERSKRQKRASAATAIVFVFLQQQHTLSIINKAHIRWQHRHTQTQSTD